jgi:hypothetical protein
MTKILRGGMADYPSHQAAAAGRAAAGVKPSPDGTDVRVRKSLKTEVFSGLFFQE